MSNNISRWVVRHDLRKYFFINKILAYFPQMVEAIKATGDDNYNDNNDNDDNGDDYNTININNNNNNNNKMLERCLVTASGRITKVAPRVSVVNHTTGFRISIIFVLA